MATVTGQADHRDLTSDRDKPQPEVSQVEVYGADEETLFRLLRSKVKYALADYGFDNEAQAIVTRLIERNVISCGIALHRSSSPGDLVQVNQVQPQLQDLMSTGFNVNSNEPVLLVLVDSKDVSSDAIRAIKEASCVVLRDTFGIFPVRVYVAVYPPRATQVNSLGNGFSLALLNVVNTDIGGPGMIQLLDSEASSLDWNRMIVLSETWHRDELIWRKDELETSQPAEQSQASVQSNSPQEGTDTDLRSLGDVADHAVESAELYDGPVSFAPATDNVVEQQEEVAGAVEAPSSQVMVEHPAMTELLAQEQIRPQIQHPSWNHAHRGGSLIDLIRSQASTVHEPESDGPDILTEGGPSGS